VIAWLVAFAAAAAPVAAAPQPDVAPQPDAAPQPPAVAPDPAPEAGSDTQPAPVEPSPSTPPAQSTPQPSTATQPPAGTEAAGKPARSRRRTTNERRKGRGDVAAAKAASRTPAMAAFRFKALLPTSAGGSDSPSHQVLLAAGALLALVLASGSLVSVSARAMKGQPR
jgi:hypothetical protein